VIPSSILDAERELRRVIERRQAGDISQCLAAYGETADLQLKSLRRDDPVRRQIFESVLYVLGWAKLMLHTRRSTLAENLRALQRTHRFLGAELRGTEPGPGPRFRIDL
jgi:hypothetical protein